MGPVKFLSALAMFAVGVAPSSAAWAACAPVPTPPGPASAGAPPDTTAPTLSCNGFSRPLEVVYFRDTAYARGKALDFRINEPPRGNSIVVNKTSNTVRCAFTLRGGDQKITAIAVSQDNDSLYGLMTSTQASSDTIATILYRLDPDAKTVGVVNVCLGIAYSYK